MGTEREFILLTVLAEGPTQLTTPEVRAFPWRQIKFLKSRSSLEIGTSFKVDDVDYVVAENAVQIDLLRDLANTSEEFENLKQLGLDATGTAQGDGIDINAPTYYWELDAATDASAEAVDFPAATVGKTVVGMNNTDVVLEVYPATDEDINGAAADAKYDHAAYSRITYYCQVEGSWIICINNY